MPVFQRTLPQPPLPTDKPDVQREADHIRAVEELKQVVQTLVTALDPFAPTQVKTADGKMVRALLQVLGNADDDTASFQPFELVSADDDDGPKVRVVVSDLVGDLPSGFSALDDPPYVLDVADGDKVYACITYDVTGNVPGPVTSRTLGNGATIPDNDPASGTFYVRIGEVSVSGGTTTPINYRYGPINGLLYRQWYDVTVKFDFVVTN